MYGSTQIELAWTIIPVLIVVVLFLTSARVIFSVQDAVHPAGTLEVTVIGHQFWWEYRYPGLNVVTANELHVPVSDPASTRRPPSSSCSRPTPTTASGCRAWQARRTSSPTSPTACGSTRTTPGLYLGQCAQYCGTQHAKMLLRVYVDIAEDFERWVRAQQQPAQLPEAVARGRRASSSARRASIATPSPGRRPTGRFGPDLTHLMSRDTIASGAAPNTRENLRRWIREPGRHQARARRCRPWASTRAEAGRSDGVPGDPAMSDATGEA